MDKIQIRATPAQADVIVTALQIARNVSRDTAWADEAQAVEVWVVHLATRHARRQAAAAELAAPPGQLMDKITPTIQEGCIHCGAAWAAESPGCMVAEYHGVSVQGQADAIERARQARVRARRERGAQG